MLVRFQRRSPSVTIRRPLRRPLVSLIGVLLAAVVAWPTSALPLRSTAEATGAAAPVTPAATDPVPLVSERVEGYTLGRTTNKAFWYATATCLPSLDPISDFAEAISRIALTGSEVRRLFLHEVNPTCTQQNRLLRPTSNLIADTNWVYFAQAGKLSRVSVFGKTDDSTAITTFGSADPTGNAGLAQDADEVFMISSASLRTSYIWRIQKADGTFTRVEVNSTFSRDFTSDGENLYWLAGTSLRVYSLAASREPLGTLDSGVNSYYAEGARTACLGCTMTKYVFIARGNQVYRRDNVTGTTTPNSIYSGPVRSEVFDITGDSQHLFLWHAQVTTCEPLCTYNATLVRTNRTSVTTPEILYAFGAGLSIPTIDTQTRNGYLYWNWNGIQTLPVNASTLALTNMEITAVEVVQSMQDLLNTVPLIQKKRTFVRLHVKSNGPAVPGVGARLFRITSNGDPIGPPLTPVNQTGTTMTVRPAPNRANIDDAFLFELPWSWSTGALRLRAELNPFKLPLQQSYAGNTRTINASFKVSPRLEVQFVAFTYTLNKTTYAPRYIEDIIQTYSWIRRAYPLASTIGSNNDSTPGFRPGLSFVTDAKLGGYVDQTNGNCEDWYPDADLRNLCASNYTNIEMAQLRSDNGDPDSLFYYGMISDAAGIFPRGQAATNKVSSGPVGIPDAKSWDTDNGYGDWYAGHEIGHTLGRDHPGAASDDDTTEAVEGCGHSRTDLTYPYANALISPPAEPVNGARFFGFDAGDAARGIPRAVLPGTQWADLMSYCARQWISDYTYKGMYDFMLANPSLAATANQTGATGDLLSVFGSISPNAGTAVIPRLRRQTSVTILPLRRPGPWSIQLLNGPNVVADYPFTPATSHDSEQPMLQVGQVVDFVPGTTTVRIVKLDTGKVYWSQAISAAPPVISDVTVRAAAPITGNAGLSWTASDADGDPLTFDVLYSRNGGPFEPYMLNYSGSSLSVDTSRLGGGSGRFRVIASDGAQTAQGASAAVSVAAKPPEPRINTPADNTLIQWGQILNLSGEAFDLQDGTIADTLEWRDNGTLLGSGSLVTAEALDVGFHTITLKATNSAGLNATASITVIVDDYLGLPSATLRVGPTATGWQVAPGSTALQTAQLAIGNSGGGLLTWSAEESAPWLTLSATSGDAPATITLTADPAGQASNTSLKTIVRFTGSAPGEGAQIIDVPVTLATGSSYMPPALPRKNLFLPLVRR